MRPLLLLLLLVLTPISAAKADSLDLNALLRNGSARVETASGQQLLAHRDAELFVPASILKVATAYCALEELGPSYRYSTELFLDSDDSLYVKGSGDPSTVSEELQSMAREVAEVTKKVKAIVVDTSFFTSDLSIDGATPSLNPYDAKNAAFVGNFSSVALRRRRDGRVESAEPQTPITSMSKRAGTLVKRGSTERIKIGNRWQDGAIYGGELLAEFLSQAGVSGPRSASLGKVPKGARLIVTHTSSRNLEEMVKGMLEHSTNFTANQIFLTLGAKKFGAPATLEKAQRAMTDCLKSRVGWSGFHIEEGSGLSRRNQVSSRQMTTLLGKFEPYRHLLAEKEGFLAKTGSLNGVNSLAGYFSLPKHGEVRFSVIINSGVPHLYKFRAAERIRSHLTNSSN